MSLTKSLDLTGTEAIAVLRGAVTDVAERSFFTPVDPSADDHVPDSDSGSHTWLVATVRFEEAGCAGVASCILPYRLARLLFDAFNGRDPADPPPPFGGLSDLVGEFANMICGAWLTRMVNGPSFLLSPPVVRASGREAALETHAGSQIVMTLNDLPLVVDIAQA